MGEYRIARSLQRQLSHSLSVPGSAYLRNWISCGRQQH